jgi:ribonuclease P protein component
MKYSESLKKNRDFQLVYKKGTSFANKYLVMYVRENQLGKNRVGISVSKKVGNSVVRHRLTRLIREGYRLQEESFQKGYDVVILVRVNGKDCTYHEIERAIYHLGKLHQIVERKSRDEKNTDQTDPMLPKISVAVKEQ